MSIWRIQMEDPNGHFVFLFFHKNYFADFKLGPEKYHAILWKYLLHFMKPFVPIWIQDGINVKSARCRQTPLVCSHKEDHVCKITGSSVVLMGCGYLVSLLGWYQILYVRPKLFNFGASLLLCFEESEINYMPQEKLSQQPPLSLDKHISNDKTQLVSIFNIT